MLLKNLRDMALRSLRSANVDRSVVSSTGVWYGILGFNVPLDTVQVISETGALSSEVHLPLSNGGPAIHNNHLNPRCFCLQRPKRDGTSF